MIFFYILMEFLCGSLMFSYWLGLAAKKNLHDLGDGNPGAFNLWHAAGPKLGILGVFLDFFKGYFPLVLLISGGYIDGMAIVPVAAAPVLGHVFSPFMKGRGGKGIAVTFGVWSAVSGFEVSFVYAVILALFTVIVKIVKKGKSTSSEADGLMVSVGMLCLGFYLIFRSFPRYMYALWLFNLIIIIFSNHKKLYNLSKIIFEKYHPTKD